MLSISIHGHNDVSAVGYIKTAPERSTLASVYRMPYHLGPGQLSHLSGPVRTAVVDDKHRVCVLAGAQDHRAYADLFVEGREDGGYGGQVGTSGKWVR